MSESNEKDSTAQIRPSFFAYTVREGKNGKAYFNRVGAAFPNKDGQGHDLQFEALPVDGRVTLRTPKERLEQQRAGTRSQTNTQEKDRGER